MEFDTKVAVVLRDDLAVWQKANVTAFLVSGIPGSNPSLVGQPYVDGSGERYLPMLRQPILISAADAPGIRARVAAWRRGTRHLHERALLDAPRRGQSGRRCRLRGVRARPCRPATAPAIRAQRAPDGRARRTDPRRALPFQRR